MMAAAALVFLTLSLTAWLLRRRGYRQVFRTSPVRDDRIVCVVPGTAIAIIATANGFDLPAGIARRGQTAFLELRVQATSAIALLDPYIEVTSSRARLRQFLDRGAVGSRLINVSPIFAPSTVGAAERIGLRGGSICWETRARLVLFESPSIAQATTLVLAPHPDDAEIAAFGVYATNPSHVVTVTAGERGTADLSAALPAGADFAAWYARLRVWDSLTIPQLGNVTAERCLNLVYPDGQLETMHQNPERPFQLGCEQGLPRAILRGGNRWKGFTTGDADCTWQGLVDDLRRIIEEIQPAVIVSPHPILDAHRDHVFTSVALEQALRSVAVRPTILLYAVHRMEARVHPFGPADAMVSPPPWTDDQPLANSIYSHPLSPELRQVKYFAVEAMHDLRTYAGGEPPTVRQLAVAAKRALSALLSGTGIRPVSFHRRAPRPNELYYLADLDLLSVLVQRALGTAKEVA
jgi:LmbE family N-acetylglucosaminyl deacetylase